MLPPPSSINNNYFEISELLITLIFMQCRVERMAGWLRIFVKERSTSEIIQFFAIVAVSQNASDGVQQKFEILWWCSGVSVFFASSFFYLRFKHGIFSFLSFYFFSKNLLSDFAFQILIGKMFFYNFYRGLLWGCLKSSLIKSERPLIAF